MKDCKMIYTEKAVKHLEELGISLRRLKSVDKAAHIFYFIYVEKGTYTVGYNKDRFCYIGLPFLEQKDLLKIGPSIAAGDFIQVPVAHGFFIREVSSTSLSKVFIKDNPTVNYNRESVKRAPDKLIAYLKEGGFLDD